MKAPQTAASKGRSTRATKIDPAKEELVTQYLPLVRFVAEKIHRRLPPGVDLESLIHSGVVGLLEALDRFDPKRGVEFEVYARYRIQGEVMQCLRSLDWVSRSVRSWGRKMEAARAKLAGQFVREPTAEEMAKELEIPLERYFRFDQQVNDATLLSLDDLAVASEGERDVAHPKFLAKYVSRSSQFRRKQGAYREVSGGGRRLARARTLSRDAVLSRRDDPAGDRRNPQLKRGENLPDFCPNRGAPTRRIGCHRQTERRSVRQTGRHCAQAGRRYHCESSRTSDREFGFVDRHTICDRRIPGTLCFDPGRFDKVIRHPER